MIKKRDFIVFFCILLHFDSHLIGFETKYVSIKQKPRIAS